MLLAITGDPQLYKYWPRLWGPIVPLILSHVHLTQVFDTTGWRALSAPLVGRWRRTLATLLCISAFLGCLSCLCCLASVTQICFSRVVNTTSENLIVSPRATCAAKRAREAKDSVQRRTQRTLVNTIVKFTRYLRRRAPLVVSLSIVPLAINKTVAHAYRKSSEEWAYKREDGLRGSATICPRNLWLVAMPIQGCNTRSGGSSTSYTIDRRNHAG